MTLVLCRHSPGDWNPEDFDVLDEDFDGLDDGCTVGRSYRISAVSGIWWWESFMLTRRKSYGDASTRAQAMAAFRAEYASWRAELDR